MESFTVLGKLTKGKYVTIHKYYSKSISNETFIFNT